MLFRSPTPASPFHPIKNKSGAIFSIHFYTYCLFKENYSVLQCILRREIFHYKAAQYRGDGGVPTSFWIGVHSCRTKTGYNDAVNSYVRATKAVYNEATNSYIRATKATYNIAANSHVRMIKGGLQCRGRFSSPCQNARQLSHSRRRPHGPDYVNTPVQSSLVRATQRTDARCRHHGPDDINISVQCSLILTTQQTCEIGRAHV